MSKNGKELCKQAITILTNMETSRTFMSSKTDEDDMKVKMTIRDACNRLMLCYTDLVEQKVKVPVSGKKVAKKSKKGVEKWGKVVEDGGGWEKAYRRFREPEQLAQRIAL